MNEAGKGDKQRPTDHNKFSDGYDAIFGKNKTDSADAQTEQREDGQKEQANERD